MSDGDDSDTEEARKLEVGFSKVLNAQELILIIFLDQIERNTRQTRAEESEKAQDQR
jgi:hypothetical protein